MITMKEIKYEDDELLKQKCEPVSIPLSDEDIITLRSLLEYVINSQDSEECEKNGLRPAVGLAAPQIGVLKRMFAIMAYDEEGKLFVLPLVNPKIISHSEETIYIKDGEGCISVRRPTEGVTPRYKEITFESLMWNYKRSVFEKTRMTLKDYMAVVFQHEYDHLDGILYTDKLFKSLPDATPIMDIEDEEEE